MPDRMLQFFSYSHLHPELCEISPGLRLAQHFSLIAHEMVQLLPSNPERTVALRKLLEAKDCAVRAEVYKEPSDA